MHLKYNLKWYYLKTFQKVLSLGLYVQMTFNTSMKLHIRT